MAQVQASPDFKKKKHKFIKRTGKKVRDVLSEFLVGQGTVGDLPVFDNEHFPFLKELEDNWEDIRAEADAILQHRELIATFDEELVFFKAAFLSELDACGVLGLSSAL